LKRILIVDDEEHIRMLYKEELLEDGYDVLTAGDGEEALKIVEREALDLIIMDVRMPKMGGIEALRKVKEIKPGLPVLLNTAYTEFKMDFGSWASEEYIIKSSNLEDLKSAVRKHLKE
jgi:DNA-binding response OmpR family regulator